MTDEHKKYLKVMAETPGIYGPMIDAVRAALAEIKRLEALAANAECEQDYTSAHAHYQEAEHILRQHQKILK